MAMEKNWAAVSQAFTANGTFQGLVTVADASGFYVKQQVSLTSNTKPNPFPLQVQRVIGPNQIYVGLPKSNIDQRQDISGYLVADAAKISAPQQAIPTIRLEDIDEAVYAREPAVALRSLGVDQFGNPFGKDNPLPVEFDGTVVVGEVEIIGPSGYLLDPNSDGSVKTIQLFTLPFDAITATYPSSAQEVYQSRVGGIAGTVQQTLTVNYTDGTKNLILNVSRTTP